MVLPVFDIGVGYVRYKAGDSLRSCWIGTAVSLSLIALAWAFLLTFDRVVD